MYALIAQLRNHYATQYYTMLIPNFTYQKYYLFR